MGGCIYCISRNVKTDLTITLQIRLWFSVEGEKHLTSLDSVNLSHSDLRQMKQDMGSFLEEAAVNCLLPHDLQ